MIMKTVVNKADRYYDTEYPNEFPVGNYYARKYGRLPSYADSDVKYEVSVSEYFKDNAEYNLIWESRALRSDSTVVLFNVYENTDTGTIVQIKYKSESKRSSGYFSPDDLLPFGEGANLRNPDYAIVTVNYTDTDYLETLAKDISKYVVISKSKSKINLVTASRHGLDIIEQDIKNVDIDLAMNYGEKFLPVHDKIVEKLSDSYGKGLVLLHGIPGTGKTNYIRYLCGQIDKEIIFLPPFLAENIASPDFIKFLLEHRNSILVIEDAEKVVLDRDSNSSNRQSVANLLNMTDGLLSDCLSIQIIATFNTSRELIDKALLRKGRLIAEWKFDKLPIEDSSKLLKQLGKDQVATEPMSLTDIYNMDEEEYVVQQERRQIGFSR